MNFKRLGIIVSICAVLFSCGVSVPEPVSRTQVSPALLLQMRKLIKSKIMPSGEAGLDLSEVLSFISNHPFAKTIGLHSRTIADSMGIHPIPWGRAVNGDSDLITKRLVMDGKKAAFIYAKGFTPAEQIAKYMDTVDPEKLKHGVLIEELADNVSFKQEDWTTHGFHIAIGTLLDKKKYVTKRLVIDGKPKKFIFAKEK